MTSPSLPFRCLALTLIILLSGCSTQIQTKKLYSKPALSQLRPHAVAIKEGQLEYYRLGHGSPVVLISGYVTDISSWNRPFLLALAKQHEVIVFNNRQVGHSWVHSSRYETTDLAKDTYQLIQALGLKKPTILGISMGGMIAQQVAVLYPGKISHLILINTALAGKAVHPDTATENLLLRLPSSKLGRYLLALKLFFPPSSRLKMSWSLAADRFQPPGYGEVEPETVLPQQRELVKHWVADLATTKKIARLDLPVLILNGGVDSVIPPVNSVILAQTIKHARFQRWPEGGHAMIYQYPQELAAVINRFIKYN